MPDDLTRILVPLDGSDTAETILPALLPMIQGRSAELVLLGVVETGAEAARVRAHFDRLRKRLLLDGIRSMSRVEEGRADSEILYWARERRCDLIAMTTHGRTGLRRVMMGSVAEAVLRESRIPLIVNRPGCKIGDWKRLVVALDGSFTSEGILPDAVHLARRLKATLHLLKVNPPVVIRGFTAYSAPEDPRRYLDAIVSRAAREGVPALPVVRQGQAADEILRYAGESEAGLLCLTTHGRTGMSRLVAGSVAEEVMRKAPCPVLIRKMAPTPVPREAESKAN